MQDSRSRNIFQEFARQEETHLEALLKEYQSVIDGR
jgi:rubrerythrin